jgi:hypothetical protein
MWHETAAHSHSAHRTTVSSHLRRGRRRCENARRYAAEKNDFFRVHNFVPSERLNSPEI